jgi:periplasmic protein TonB
MNISAFALLTLTLPFAVADRAEASCLPELAQDSTSFPERAQLRGQRGIVLLDVLVDSNGRAAQAEIVDSSGYRLLDRSAEESVLKHWQFDVSSCERKDLPMKRRVAVEYRNEEY